MKSSRTRPGWTYTAKSKSTEQIILRHTPPLWRGLPSGLWSSLESFSVGPFHKWTLLWHIHKLQLRWTSIWNCHKGFKPSMGTPRNTFEAREEHLRLETGWACVEFVPCGQTHVHRIHNVTNRWLCFLLQWHHFHGVRGWWYLPRQQRLATSRRHEGDPESRPQHWRLTPSCGLCRCQHQETKRWFLLVHPISINWFHHRCRQT